MNHLKHIFVAVAAVVFAGALIAPLSAAQLNSADFHGKHVLSVVWLASKAHPTDLKVQQHLESLGCVVKMVDDVAPVTAADGQDLIIISSTVSGKNVEGRFKHSATPVLLWESNILDDMSMCGKHQEVDWGEDEKPEQTYIWLVNAPHPLSAGLPNGLLSPFADSVKKSTGANQALRPQSSPRSRANRRKPSFSAMNRVRSWTTISPHPRAG